VSALWDVSEHVTKALSSEDTLVATEEGAIEKASLSGGWPSMVDETGAGSMGADVNLAARTGAGPGTVVPVRVNEAESIVECRLI
jgi:hypothetical protein